MRNIPHFLCERGRLSARCTVDPVDVALALEFRETCFESGTGNDADRFDAECQHVLITNEDTGRLVGYFRFAVFEPVNLQSSYSGQFYDLSALYRFPGRMLEVGRFCTASGERDPDILRLSWAAITHYVDRHAVSFLFGCSSFAGTDAEPYRAAFGLLSDRYLATPAWRPGRKAAEVVGFESAMRADTSNLDAWSSMPSLLRTYLGMGGRVSDHAVVDRKMKTLHVFTGVETAGIPLARQKRLRALLH